MARMTEWKDLRIGLAAFVGVVAVALSILVFARVGALHGETTSIYVLTRSAPGVLNGTDVWLSGAKVGQVKDIHFRPASSDTLERVAIHLEILSDQMNFIRKDAYADIRPGGNLIGSPVVWISSGTSRAPGLQEGDSLVDRPSGKMQPVGDRVTSIVTRLTALTDSGGRVISLLNSQIGTAGKIVGTGLPRVATAASSMSDILRRAGSGNGSIAMIRRANFGAQVAGIRAATDSITSLLSTGNGNVAQLRRDSTLPRKVAHLSAELDTLRNTFGGETGIMRARSDTALTAEMARLRAELAALMADIKKHPLQYINF